MFIMSTRSHLKLIAIAFALVGTPPTAVAQSRAEIVQSRYEQALARAQEPLEGRPPIAGLSQRGAFGQLWSVNSIYVVFRGERPQTRFYVIRRSSGDMKTDAQTVWADSRSCAALERVLVAMENIPAVWPDVPGLGRESDTISIVADGVGHTFWSGAKSGPEDAVVDLEVRGNVNSPVAIWWDWSMRQLTDCWSLSAPDP